MIVWPKIPELQLSPSTWEIQNLRTWHDPLRQIGRFPTIRVLFHHRWPSFAAKPCPAKSPVRTARQTIQATPCQGKLVHCKRHWMHLQGCDHCINHLGSSEGQRHIIKCKRQQQPLPGDLNRSTTLRLDIVFQFEAVTYQQCAPGWLQPGWSQNCGSRATANLIGSFFAGLTNGSSLKVLCCLSRWKRFAAFGRHRIMDHKSQSTYHLSFRAKCKEFKLALMTVDFRGHWARRATKDRHFRPTFEASSGSN